MVDDTGPAPAADYPLTIVIRQEDNQSATGMQKDILVPFDRASGPYAATWDAKRRVVWIATSNADAIYRFDPGD